MTIKADRRIRDKTINRFEVMDQTLGRLMVKYDVSVELLYQDDGQTLKIVLKEKIPLGEDTRPKDRIKQGISPSTIIEEMDCTKEDDSDYEYIDFAEYRGGDYGDDE
jgi:hypothetical protein|tara:strand:+ start:176 stop:496 length:321 start_codon:yes stop_codon:yes gene_type:complete